MLKFSLAGVLALAHAVFAALSQHDTTGALSSPTATLEQKASAVEPAMVNAADDIVANGLVTKLGPEGAVAAEVAVPMLNNIVASAQARISALLSQPAAQAQPEPQPQPQGEAAIAANL